MCNGYRIVSELIDILQSGYYESPQGYNKIDWFVKDVMKEKNNKFFFKNTKKNIVMTEKDKKHSEIFIICLFWENR